MKMLAIDPGYATCGWVVLEWKSTDRGLADPVVLEYNCMLMPATKGSGAKTRRFTVVERTIAVCQELQLVSLRHEPDRWVTEKYYGAGRAGTDVDRGSFDMALRLAMAHVRQGHSVHPGLLKKYVTGKGNAKKDEMENGIYTFGETKDPEFFSALRDPKSGLNTGRRIHVLEAYAMGLLIGDVLNMRLGHKEGLAPSLVKALNTHDGKLDFPESPAIEAPVWLPPIR